MQEQTDTVFRPSKLRGLLEHFGAIGDPREPPWGRNHLSFLRRFSEFHFGTPCADWLRVVMNRIDPELFSACFCDWAMTLRPDAAKLIAIDGKTSRRSHDRKCGRRALHMVSAFATGARLVLAQEAVDEKQNECAVIPDILDRLDLDGALVTIDAIACNPPIAGAITGRKGDYVLAVKANQPTLHREIARYFDDPAAERRTHTDTDKGHGRLETRRYHVSHQVEWLKGDRRYPDEPRFPGLAAIAMVEATTEQAGAVTMTRRFYLSSAKLTPERLAEAVRGHWTIENSLHWVLDVVFNEDRSRLRKGHGAYNMAIVRHFAINAVRLARGKHSIKTTRKRAGWDPNELARILTPTR